MELTTMRSLYSVQIKNYFHKQMFKQDKWVTFLLDTVLQISQILNFSRKWNLHEISQKFSIREIQYAWNISQIIITGI